MLSATTGIAAVAVVASQIHTTTTTKSTGVGRVLQCWTTISNKGVAEAALRPTTVAGTTATAPFNLECKGITEATEAVEADAAGAAIKVSRGEEL